MRSAIRLKTEMRRIYLDHAATTPVRAEVLEAMLPYFSGGYNASSLHAEGRAARAAIDDARASIAAILGCKPREIVFCGSGTEADNLAVIGTARAAKGKGRHIVASAIEHHAVLHALDALREEGFETTLLEVGATGVVDPARFAAALRPDTVLATVMYANNEIGTVQPIAELAEIARARGIVFATDAVQAGAALPLDVRALRVDCLTLSAHKLEGPKGAGALYVREGTPLEPVLRGGGQERGRRPGTEDVAGIVGLAAALGLAQAERDAYVAHTRPLRDRLESALLAAVPASEANGKASARLPNMSSVTITGVAVEPLLIGLDLEGVAVSAGSACAAGSLERSHVIAAVRGSERPEEATLRFSLGRLTTAAEVERVAALVPPLVAAQRAAAPAAV